MAPPDQEAPLQVLEPADRPDRLPAVVGTRSRDLTAEVSSDDGHTWRPATIYPGETVDDWRQVDPEVWNQSVTEGILPAGDSTCVWACWFDVDDPGAAVSLRLRSGNDLLLVQEVYLPTEGLVVNHRTLPDVTDFPITDPWSLRPADDGEVGTPSIHGAVKLHHLESEYPTAVIENADHQPLVIKPGLDGWHRIYLGTGPESSVRLSLGAEGIDTPVPNQSDGKLNREFLVTSADLSGQDIRLKLGGSRVWQDVSIRYLRCVPMTDAEIRDHLGLRSAAAAGRPFAGYLEHVTDGYYNGDTISLSDFTRNSIDLLERRGCTDVYAHVIRIGFSAWYHSDVIDRYLPEGPEYERQDPAQLRWTTWMGQGDPLQVAVDEARRTGLRIYADAGMNITYLATDRFHYRAMTGAFAEDHPELMCADDLSFFDYRHLSVRDYAASIIDELLLKYDLDGVHLDFARFAYNKAFDHDSLVDVVRRAHETRETAARKWGHPVAISVRIPSYIYHHWDRYTGDFPEFLAALRTWAQNGWIDRAMICSMLLDRLPDLSLKRYLSALSGTDVELWGDLYATPDQAPTSHLLRIAENWCRQGLNGGFFIYDTGRPIDFDDINWRLRAIDSSTAGESD